MGEGQFITVVGNCLPRIFPHSINSKEDVLSVRAHVVSPYIIAVYLRVKTQFGKQEPHYRLGYSPIVFGALNRTVFIGKERLYFLQFLYNKAEGLAARTQHHVAALGVHIGDYGYSAVEVHEVEIIHSTYGAQLVDVRLYHVCLALAAFLVVGDILYALVAEHHHLIKVVPRVLKGSFACRPSMHKQAYPQTPVVPVAATDRYYLLVGGKRVKVVNALGCTLQSLTVFASAYIVINVKEGITAETLHILKCLVLVEGIARVLVKIAAARRKH